MASTPLASPSRRYHPTSSPFFDSPGDSSVIFGAGGSLSPSKANILTPTSRRETLILPQGFAGRGKSLVVDSPSAVTNNSGASTESTGGRPVGECEGRLTLLVVLQNHTYYSTRPRVAADDPLRQPKGASTRRSSLSELHLGPLVPLPARPNLHPTRKTLHLVALRGARLLRPLRRSTIFQPPRPAGRYAFRAHRNQHGELRRMNLPLRSPQRPFMSSRSPNRRC